MAQHDMAEEQQIMGMYHLILKGRNQRDAVKEAKKLSWGKGIANSRLCRRYIQAREWFREDLFSYRETALDDILQKYHFLYRRAIDRDNVGADWLAKGVLQDIRGLLKLDEASPEEDMAREDLIKGIKLLMEQTGQ